MGRARALAAGAFALGAGACALLVPDTIPQFLCESVDDSCPPGMTCDLATHQCGPPIDAPFTSDTGVTDVASEETSIPPSDAPSDTGACRGLGCKCSGPTDCDSRICADQTTITPGLYTEVGYGFCIAPCCTSADCAEGFICFGTDVGGNYCISPSLVSRSTTQGSNAGGSSCSSDTQCRSGLCSGSTCQDTCCSMFQNTCASGSACRYGAFPGRSIDTHFVSHCTTPGGSGGSGSFCSGSSSCKSNLCYYAFCEEACRSSVDCPGGYCAYAVDSSNDIFAACFPGLGSVSLGGTCSADSDCTTALCDPTTKLCTDVCYGDSDCAAMTGWVCRPETLTVKGGGFASVLLCGTAL